MFDIKRPLHVVFLFSLLICSQLYALDTEMIDEVMEKDVAGQTLTSYDQQIVEDFWSQAIEEMLTAKDFNEVIEVRSAILSKKPQALAGDYYDAFTTAAKENISSALNEIKSWDNYQLRDNLKANLLILAAQIQSPELIGFAIANIDSQNTLVRYWCLKAITSDAIVERLNSEIVSDEAQVENIFNAVKKITENENSGEILELAVKFIVQLDSSEAKQLLLNVVDKRIKTYETWNVTCELMDTRLLMFLGTEMLTETRSANRAQITRKFAQLYSYVMQRYIIGKDILNDTQKQNLASVMITVEKNMIGKLLEKPQSTIKRSIEKRSTTSLKREHDTLLGTSSLTGELARKIEFDYGKSAGGRAMNAPKTLPNPPAPAK